MLSFTEISSGQIQEQSCQRGKLLFANKIPHVNEN